MACCGSCTVSPSSVVHAVPPFKPLLRSLHGLTCLNVFNYSEQHSSSGLQPLLSCVSVTALNCTHWLTDTLDLDPLVDTEPHTDAARSYHVHPEFPDLVIQTLPSSICTGFLRVGQFAFSPERGRIFSHPPEQTLGSLPADFCLYVFQIRDGVAGRAFIHHAGMCKEKISPKDYVRLVCLWLSLPSGLDDILCDSRWAVLDCA